MAGVACKARGGGGSFGLTGEVGSTGAVSRCGVVSFAPSCFFCFHIHLTSLKNNRRLFFCLTGPSPTHDTFHDSARSISTTGKGRRRRNSRAATIAPAAGATRAVPRRQREARRTQVGEDHLFDARPTRIRSHQYVILSGAPARTFRLSRSLVLCVSLFCEM